MDEVARFQSRHLRHHHQEQRIGGDVERHAEENVRAALVELEAQSSVRHVELEERVARRQVHVAQIRHVPGADDDPPGVRIMLDGIDRKVKSIEWIDNHEQLLFSQDGDHVTFRAVGFPYGTFWIVRIAKVTFQ